MRYKHCSKLRFSARGWYLKEIEGFPFSDMDDYVVYYKMFDIKLMVVSNLKKKYLKRLFCKKKSQCTHFLPKQGAWKKLSLKEGAKTIYRQRD